MPKMPKTPMMPETPKTPMPLPTPRAPVLRSRLPSPAILALAVALAAALAAGVCPAGEGPHDRALRILQSAVAERDLVPRRDKARLAADVWLTAEKGDPDNLEHAFWAGRALVVAEDDRAARQVADRIRRRSPFSRDPRAAFIEAEVHVLGKRTDLAVPLLERLRVENPNFYPQDVAAVLYRARLIYGDTLVREGDLRYTEAAKQFLHAASESLVTQKMRDIALRNLAQVYRFAEELPKSQRIWEDLTTRYPNEAVFFYGLASIHAVQNRWDKAIDAWRTTLALVERGQFLPDDEPTLRDSRLRYGICLLFLKREAEALAEITKWVEANPQEYLGAYYLGVYYEERDPEKAVEWLEKAHRLDPWCENAIRLLIKLHSAAVPNPERVEALQTELDDPEIAKLRKAELERRKHQRDDFRSGCD